MISAPAFLAVSNPMEHIRDVPWRIGGHDIPWMSAHIGVMILAALILVIGLSILMCRGQGRSDRVGLGLIEILVTFVRVQIAQIALGKSADKAVPYLTTLFVFLLTVNVLGLVPLMDLSIALGLKGWGGIDASGRVMNITPIGGTATSGLWVAAAFAAMTLMLVFLAGYAGQVHKLWRYGEEAMMVPPVAEHAEHAAIDPGMNFWLDWSQKIESRKWPLPIAVVGGVWTWLNSFVPALPGVVGLLMWPILLFLEMIGYVTKCFALCIRLVANMSSGHILLAVLLGFAQGGRGWMTAAVGVPAGVGVVALMMLELMVALLQAYLFTFLSALFIGLAVNPQH